MYLRIANFWDISNKCDNKIPSDFIYALSEKEKDLVKSTIKNSDFWSTKWLEKEREEAKKKEYLLTEHGGWLFFIEGVKDQEYQYVFSTGKGYEPDTLFKKDINDNSITIMARELLNFAYQKIINGEVRHFSYNRLWELQKPFEGCKKVKK